MPDKNTLRPLESAKAVIDKCFEPSYSFTQNVVTVVKYCMSAVFVFYLVCEFNQTVATKLPDLPTLSVSAFMVSTRMEI